MLAWCVCLLILSALCQADYHPHEPTDLTWPFDERTTAWPNTRPFEFLKKLGFVNPNGFWYAMNEYASGEHVGTHLDAPYHFNEQGWKVGDIPLDRLMAPGVCIRVISHVAAAGGDFRLQPEHVLRWEDEHGRIKNGTIALVQFGWSRRYGRQDYMKDQAGNLTFPGLSKGSAELLVARGVLGVGVDTASVDYGKSADFPAHRVFAKNNIFGMENVLMPENLPETGFRLIALPMKIKEGTGAPLRLVAIPEITTQTKAVD